MIDTAQPPTTQQDTISVADLRAAGLTPRQIHRLELLRDCLRCYPLIEHFTGKQWRQLLFLKWRYDHGEYVEDLPSPKPVSDDVTVEQFLTDTLESD